MQPPPDEEFPHWVKVMAVVVLAIALLALVLKVAGVAEHGPGRHAVVERGDA